ncbi:MAG: malate dehydrogenase [candidate division Zixibacteria bacterium]|nr:malate dehydrogenase [candidate division Zixibacteria bacterium]MBU1469418.1 malate dehydrogenase [candidate division Zixibacteria bacterium]MBU2624172.1 malate dehydrogenase [candidate division Zixibacteria bacterium]
MRRKVAVIGAGNVGASVAQYLAQKNLCNIVLVDIPEKEGMPAGKALDLMQAGPIDNYDCSVVGTFDFAEIKDSDIVVVTSGLARKPGMSREDLLKANAAIIKSVSENVAKHAPQSMVIMVANPLDLMTYHAWKVTGFPTNRVFGQAGILDSIRFRTFVAMELGVSVNDTQAMVLGGHGDTMVPVPSYTTVAGIPITELLPADRIQAICDRTRTGGGEIVKLLKTGSAYYAPARAAVDMVESVLSDRKRVLPCSAYLTGQYGLKDVYIGVPCVLGANGVEKIFELKLSVADLELLQKSGNTYKEHLKELGY